MRKTQQPWITQGYATFAAEGPAGLKVERLAKNIGKNKSSFYHHFADLEIFTTILLKVHLPLVRCGGPLKRNLSSVNYGFTSNPS